MAFPLIPALRDGGTMIRTLAGTLPHMREPEIWGWITATPMCSQMAGIIITVCPMAGSPISLPGTKSR